MTWCNVFLSFVFRKHGYISTDMNYELSSSTKKSIGLNSYPSKFGSKVFIGNLLYLSLCFQNFDFLYCLVICFSEQHFHMWLESVNVVKLRLAFLVFSNSNFGIKHIKRKILDTKRKVVDTCFLVYTCKTSLVYPFSRIFDKKIIGSQTWLR